MQTPFVAAATAAVVVATYGGAVAIWTTLPGTSSAPAPVVRTHQAAQTMRGMKMAPGMKMPATSP